MEFEDMFQFIGHFGPYQLLVFLLVGFLGVCHGYEALAMIFLGLGQDHFCFVEELQQFPHEMQKYIAIPWVEDSYSRCEMYDLPWSWFNLTDLFHWNRTTMTVNATTSKCHKWNYGLSLFSRTVQTEFDLVCHNGWYIQLASTCYLAGMMVGSFLSGILSDRFGRLRVMIWGSTLHPIIGVAIAYCPNIQLFCFLRFLVGVAAFSAFLSGYVYVSELIGPKYRTAVCLAYNSTFGVGAMVNAVEAYFVRDYSRLMLVMCLPVCVTTSYFWILPDSARWLNVTGKQGKALDVVKLIADVNKRNLPPDVQLTCEQKKGHKGNLFDLFRYPELRKTTLIAYFLWFTNSLLYFGLALNMGSLVGDVFMNAFIGATLDAGAQIFSGIFAEKIGRRPALFGCFFIGGMTNLAIIPLIILNKGQWLLLVLTLLGRAGACASFSMGFLVSAELFPTEIRQVAMGSCSTCSRFSGVVAPYIGGPLSTVWKPLPPLIFGMFGMTSAFLTLLLRETLNQPMPDTIEDVERIRKRRNVTPLPSDKTEHGRDLMGSNILETIL